MQKVPTSQWGGGGELNESGATGKQEKRIAYASRVATSLCNLDRQASADQDMALLQ